MKRYLLGILLLVSSASLKAQSWQSVGSGTNGEVIAFCMFNNSLYIGGSFTSAGGIPASYMANWNGIKWDSVGAGVVPISGGGIGALLAFDSVLYIGGEFNTMGHLPCASIGQWNYTNYDTMSSGLSNSWGIGVWSAMRYKSLEYFGGNFDTTVHGKKLSGIASWNGHNWDSVKGGINGLVTCMAIYNNVLYVGGEFNLGSNSSVINIVSWDGTKWDSLGWDVSLNGPVYALCVYNGKLYAGGSFFLANNLTLPVNNIACWNGSRWDSVGGGINSVGIASMTVYNNELVVGGYFDSAGRKPAGEIAAWDGTSWHAIGNGLQGGSVGVWCLGVYDTTLYAGGDFTASGSTPLNNIAMWSGPLGVNELKVESEKLTVFPNPSSNGMFTVEINNPQLGINNEIEVYDVLGERIYQALLPQTPKGALSNSTN